MRDNQMKARSNPALTPTVSLTTTSLYIMPAITRSAARHHAAAANAAPIARRRPQRGVAQSDLYAQLATPEGDKELRAKVERPNLLPKLLQEFSAHRTRLRGYELMVREEKEKATLTSTIVPSPPTPPYP
ncbi:hypothetical protein H1R20_g5315, partial [Candolleomyces eurysporus]